MFKKFIPIFVLLALSQTVLGESHNRRFAISADPVKAIHASLGGLFQYKMTDFVSLTVPLSFGTNWPAIFATSTMATITDEKYSSSLLFGGAGIGARFLLNRNGFNDGFFAEPRVMVSMSKYNLKKDEEMLINSNRLSLTPSLLVGYSWFFNNGLYISAGLEAGIGFHMKNDVMVEKLLATRLKDKATIKSRLWADESRWRFEYGYDISLGYSW